MLYQLLITDTLLQEGERGEQEIAYQKNCFFCVLVHILEMGFVINHVHPHVECTLYIKLHNIGTRHILWVHTYTYADKISGTFSIGYMDTHIKMSHEM